MKALCVVRRSLVVLTVLAILYLSYLLTLHFIVVARLNGIRKSGYPVTLAELDNWYPQVSKQDNAAEVYLEAFKHFAPIETADANLPIVGEAKLPPRGQPMAEGTKLLAAAHLEKNLVALTLLHKGVELQKCRYPVDLTQGGAVILPHLTFIRQGVRLLCLEAVIHAESGEADQSGRSIVASLAIANSLSAEPIEISQLVRLACFRIAATHLEAVLNRSGLSEESLIELLKRLSAFHPKEALIRGYAGQRCLDIAFHKDPVAWTLSMSEKKASPEELKQEVLFMRSTGRLDMLLMRDLEGTAEFLHACELPFPESVKLNQYANPPPPFASYFVAGTWRLTSGPTTVQLAALNSAKISAALAGLAIERHRLATGSLPTKLDEVARSYLAAALEDPFDGQPLRYKKRSTGYVVYSIGLDGKDDDGDEFRDITFIVER